MVKNLPAAWASIAVTTLLWATVPPTIAGDVDLEGIKCVISGKEVSADTWSEYKDGKVYFCCPGCSSGFAKDSKKYAVKANHQLVATKQFKQTACPLSGRELDPSIFSKVAGTKIGFCCEGCKGKFDHAKDDAAKLELVFAEKNFAKGFKKVKKEESR